MYMGDNIEAMPTPIPAKKRAAIKKSLFGENAIPREDIPNTAAAINSPGLRPFLSASLPALTQPIMAPRARLPVANPSQYSLRSNFSFRKGRAPDITAKSKPNKYPPSAEMKDKARMYLELYGDWSLFMAKSFKRQSCFYFARLR